MDGHIMLRLLQSLISPLAQLSLTSLHTMILNICELAVADVQAHRGCSHQVGRTGMCACGILPPRPAWQRPLVATLVPSPRWRSHTGPHPCWSVVVLTICSRSEHPSFGVLHPWIYPIIPVGLTSHMQYVFSAYCIQALLDSSHDMAQQAA